MYVKGRTAAAGVSTRRSSSDELNVKKVVLTQMMSADLLPTASSRSLETVGPKYGKLLGRHQPDVWQHWTATAAMDELNEKGVLHL